MEKQKFIFEKRGITFSLEVGVCTTSAEERIKKPLSMNISMNGKDILCWSVSPSQVCFLNYLVLNKMKCKGVNIPDEIKNQIQAWWDEEIEKAKKEIVEEEKRIFAQPLTFKKEEGRYFACDQSWEISYMSPSRKMTEEEEKKWIEILEIAKKMEITETMPHTGYTGVIRGKIFQQDEMSMDEVMSVMMKSEEYRKMTEKEQEAQKDLERKREESRKNSEEIMKKISEEKIVMVELSEGLEIGEKIRNEIAKKNLLVCDARRVMKELARKSGRKQFFRTIGGYDGDSDREAQKKYGYECGFITISEYIDAEGNITTNESAGY